MGWTNTATARFGMHGPQASDAFSHTDFDSLISALDGDMVKGTLFRGFPASSGDIHLSNDATVTLISATVTVPANPKKVLIVASAWSQAAAAGGGYMGLILASGGTTLVRRYVYGSTSGAITDGFGTLIYVDNPTAGSTTYNFKANPRGSGAGADGNILQTAQGSGDHLPELRAHMAIFEL